MTPMTIAIAAFVFGLAAFGLAWGGPVYAVPIAFVGIAVLAIASFRRRRQHAESMRRFHEEAEGTQVEFTPRDQRTLTQS